MLNPFKKYLASVISKPEQKKFLLAVSGGVDSVVMAELYNKAGYSFAIAHCNFQLRGSESDGDEGFVKKIAEKYKVPFHVKRFNTMAYAESHKVSVQMAARDLRYEWLKESAEKHSFDHIVIAHHADDAVETFFINLLRGTGIAGLHGIPSVSHAVLRPMLCFSRKEIKEFAIAQKLAWREDSSNASDKYERNKIRHHLIPELLKINLEASRAISHTIENLKETEIIYREAIEEKMNKLVALKGDKINISSIGLKKLKYPHVYLYEYLKKYGFNFVQAKEICDALEGQAGKIFLSETYRLVKDRRSLVLETIGKENKNEDGIIYPEDDKFEGNLFKIEISQKEKPIAYKPYHPSSVGCFDYDKLVFPLTVRKWAAGDKFYPLGMKQPKKISDFLIDNKVSLSDKDNVYVMVSGKDIAWVIGHRIDDRFKIVSATKKLYICNIVNTD